MIGRRSSHQDAEGTIRMVDVGDKATTLRSAHATGRLHIQADAAAALKDPGSGKGDAMLTARIAGIMAAKRTAELVPLCHPVSLSNVEIDVGAFDGGLKVDARVSAHGPTGVEMEALTAVTVALLTLYDMGKSLDRRMVIDDIRVTAKTGGRSGDWLS